MPQYAASGPLRLVYTGRIVQEQKRVLDLEHVAARLDAKRVDFELTIVGDGVEREALEAGLSRFGRRCRFAGLLPPAEVANIVRQHDVFVQVSEFEGTSVSMLEAMAEGRVPVITKVASGIDGLLDETNSIVVDAGDTSAMADRLAELAGDRQRIARLGRAAYATAQQHSIAGNVEALARVFDAVLEGPRRTWPAGKSLRPKVPIAGGVLGSRRVHKWMRRFRRLTGMGPN